MSLKTELEANLTCPKCGGTPYRIYRQQVSEGSEIFKNLVWPGKDGTPPPPDVTDIRCPKCSVALERS